MILDREKFEGALSARGLNLSRFAKNCGISRRSIYEMFEGRSIFSVPFEKILSELNVDISEITKESSRLETILGKAPSNILKLVLKLQEFAKQYKGDLFLIGSRARGKTDVRSDWDFAIFFAGKKIPAKFVSFKQKVIESAFPYKMDIVVLNDAPEWFLNSISDDAIRIEGKTPENLIFDRVDSVDNERNTV